MNKTLTTKHCSHCKVEKMTSEFGRCRSNADGLCYWCKVCRKSKSPMAYARRKASGMNAVYDKRHREKQAGTWKEFYDTVWNSMNARTVNGTHPAWKSSGSVKNYLSKGVRIEITREEFKDWCMGRSEQIEGMYRVSKEKNDSGLRPSIDRIDALGNYAIGNIRVLEKRLNVVGGNERKHLTMLFSLSRADMSGC